uniref:Secreted protein n=1 Tax=Ascaris lumbricoides TaxID=6252 RepID=A0A0M3HNR6_ASCLU
MCPQPLPILLVPPHSLLILWSFRWRHHNCRHSSPHIIHPNINNDIWKEERKDRCRSLHSAISYQ